MARMWGSSEKGTSSALKIQVELDLSRGILVGPFLTNGKDTDVTSVLNKMILPSGSLQIGDLGYWSIGVFKEIEQNQSYFLSRYKTMTAAFDKEGKRWDVCELLEAQGSSEIDMEIELGVEDRFRCRLLATRVPSQVAAQRRRKWRAEAKREGHTLSKQKLAMADWSIFLTNVAQSLLTLKEALVLARARWQIELLFKLCKSYGQIDKSRSQKTWRILCELYAKLIIMVIEHWILIVGCWAFPSRSLPKAVQLIQKHAFHLASVFVSFFNLRKALSIIVRGLARCLMNKRKS
ncbi:MAG: transposase IS4 family protein, partial [bacterium]